MCSNIIGICDEMCDLFLLNIFFFQFARDVNASVKKKKIVKTFVTSMLQYDQLYASLKWLVNTQYLLKINLKLLTLNSDNDSQRL